MVVKRTRKRARTTKAKQPATRSLTRMTESKFCDLNVGGSLGLTATVTLLNGIEIGTGANQRIGRNVYLDKIDIWYQLNNVDISISAGAHDVRVLVFLDKAPIYTGAAPVVTDLLQTVTTAGAASTNSASMLNMDNRNRFHILHDNVVNIPPYTLASGNKGFVDPSAASCNKRLSIKLNKKMQFTGSTSAFSSIATNALYFMVFDNIAGLTWYHYLQTRLYFNDL